MCCLVHYCLLNTEKKQLQSVNALMAQQAFYSNAQKCNLDTQCHVLSINYHTAHTKENFTYRISNWFYTGWIQVPLLDNCNGYEANHLYQKLKKSDDKLFPIIIQLSLIKTNEFEKILQLSYRFYIKKHKYTIKVLNGASKTE